MKARLPLFFWFFFLFKIALDYFLPLSADEAYYWVWGQRLQLSYFDHPPAVAWMFRLGSLLPGLERWPGIVLSQMTLWIWWKILSDQLSSKKLLWWWALILSSPLLGIGGLILTPDVPLVFFYSLGVWLFLKYDQDPNLKTALAIGAVLGFGFASKYLMVLFPLSIFTYLIFEKTSDYRKWLTHFLAAGMVAIICSSPVWIWNFQHNWVSFRFQIQHGVGESVWDPWWTLSYVLGQLFLIFPTSVISAFRASVPGNWRSLIYFAFVPLIFFFVTSFKGSVELNWPIFAQPAVLALAVLGMRSAKPVLVASLTFLGLATIVISHQFFPWASFLPDKVNEFRHFEPVIEYVNSKNFIKDTTYASSYQMASQVWYRTGSSIDKLPRMSRIDFFDQLAPEPPLKGRLRIILEKGVAFPDWLNPKAVPIKSIEHLSPEFEVVEVNL